MIRSILPTLRVLCAVSALVAACGIAPAAAQSVNIDFGAAGSPPSAAYAAAGPAGVWNEIAVLPPAQRAPLVGLDGSPVAAQIYMIGGTALMASDDPATAGDDAGLVDDMLIGYNNPIDVCVWVENLTNGDYVVTIYALTPNDPTLNHRVRVDFATPDAVEIGGAWPGGHVDGVTFKRFNVTVTAGKIGLHSGLQGGNFESGINGIQIYPASTGIEPSESRPEGFRLESFYPNPSSGRQTFVLSGAAANAAGALEIVDASGRLVWRTDLAGVASGRSIVDWEGRDQSGRPVSQGVYFLRLPGVGEAAGRPVAGAKIVRID